MTGTVEMPAVLRGLPRNLKQMTEEQRGAYVDFLARKEMPDLRKRQVIVRCQKQAAWEKYQKTGHCNATAADNLDVLDDLLMQAVWQANFTGNPTSNAG